MLLRKLHYEAIKLKMRVRGRAKVNHRQLARQHCLKMLNHALTHYTDAMTARLDSDSGALFMEGCIRLIDGESDPRNILLSFTLFRSLF